MINTFYPIETETKLTVTINCQDNLVTLDKADCTIENGIVTEIADQVWSATMRKFF